MMACRLVGHVVSDIPRAGRPEGCEPYLTPVICRTEGEHSSVYMVYRVNLIMSLSIELDTLVGFS